MRRIENLENSVRLEGSCAFTTLQKEPLAFQVCQQLYVLSPQRGNSRLQELDQKALSCLRQTGSFVLLTGETFNPKITPETAVNLFWLAMRKIPGQPDVERVLILKHYLHCTNDFSQQNLIIELVEKLNERHELMLNLSRVPPLAEEASLYEFSFLFTDYVRFRLQSKLKEKIEAIVQKYGPREKTPWHYLYGITLPFPE